MNPIDKVGEQEYIFSSRADRVLKAKQTAPQEVCKTMKKNIDTIQLTALPPPGAELLAKNLSVR